MTIDRTRQGTIATYGKYPANLIMGSYAIGVYLGGTYRPVTGLFESTDILGFQTGNGFVISSNFGYPSTDIVSGNSNTIYNNNITNTTSAPIFTVTLNHVKPVRKQIIVPYGNVFLANIAIQASNNTSGDTTYWTSYLTLNYVANGVVTNIVPRIQVYADNVTSTSGRTYGTMISYVIPNDIIIPIGARIQMIVEVDGYVSAGGGTLQFIFSGSNADLSGNNSSSPQPGTWFSLPVLVE